MELSTCVKTSDENSTKAKRAQCKDPILGSLYYTWSDVLSPEDRLKDVNYKLKEHESYKSNSESYL